MQKKQPLRKCLGCQEKKLKKELMRIVKTKDGNVFIDKTGKSNGRGTYVCSNECAKKVIKKRILDKVFDEKLDDEIYEELERVTDEK